MDLTVWVKLAAFLGAGLSMGLGAVGSGRGNGPTAGSCRRLASDHVDRPGHSREYRYIWFGGGPSSHISRIR